MENTTTPGSAAPGGAPQELVGSVLAGRYRILEKLGEGAMGAVYLGEHVRMGRRDAIKVLLGPLSRDPEAVARFNRGARNVSAIHHPNVCTIYDFSDTAEGLTFMAMELIVGESLKDLLQREGALPVERAVAITRQVADALQAAHDAGIVHRDLKPGNIMLTHGRDGADVVKVVDFDIAKEQAEAEGTELTRVGFVVGTPEYMSPEQLIGEHLDGRSDLYSLALCLFRMLTGALPFRAETSQELMIQRLTHTPLRLAEAAPGRAFPEGLQRALDRALALKAADRQASAAEFGREVVAALATSPAAPAPAAAEPVPPTIVAPAPVTLAATVGAPATAPPGAPAGPAHARRATAAGGGGGRRALVYGAAALVLIVAGSLAWWARGRAGARTDRRAVAAAPAVSPPAPGHSSSPPATSPPALPANASTATTSAAAPAAGVQPPPAREPADVPARPAATPVRRPAPTGAPPAGRDDRGGAARPGIVAADAKAIIWRQFDRIGPPYPPAAQVRAIRDTAAVIADLAGVADKERALAAFVLAHTYIATGEDSRVLPLLQRAVALDPTAAGYRTLLSQYRRGDGP